MEGFFPTSYGNFLAHQDTKRDEFIEKPPRKLNCFGEFRQNKLRQAFPKSNCLASLNFKTAFIYPQEGRISFKSELYREKRSGGVSAFNTSGAKSRTNSSFIIDNNSEFSSNGNIKVMNRNLLRLQTSIKNSLDIHLKLKNQEPLSILLITCLPYFQNIKIYAKLKQNLTKSGHIKSNRSENHVKIGGVLANNKINANLRLTEQYNKRLLEARVNMTLAHKFYLGAITRINVTEGIFDRLALLINYKRGPLDVFLENRNFDNLLLRQSTLSLFYQVRENLSTALFIIMKSQKSKLSDISRSNLYIYSSYSPTNNLQFNVKLSSAPYFQGAVNWKINKYMDFAISTTPLPAKLPHDLIPLRIGVKIKTY